MYTIGRPGGYFIGFNKKTGLAQFRTTTECRRRGHKPPTWKTREEADQALIMVSQQSNPLNLDKPSVRQVRWDNSLIKVK